MRELLAGILGGRVPQGETPTYRTILDLGTEQTKALVVQSRGRESVILGAGRSRHERHVSHMGGAPIDVPAMVRSCDRALRQAEDMTERCCEHQVVPDWVVVGVPDCLTAARTHTVTHRRSHPSQRITEGELADVAKRAQRLALRELGDKVNARLGGPGTRLALLEARLTAIRVDGRSVTSPVGLQGEKVTVTVLNVVVPASYLDVVEAVVAQLGLDILDVRSSWQALASATIGKRAICIDLGGSTTDFMLVQNGEPRATATVALGGRDFTAQLAKALTLSERDAERLKLAYCLGQLDQHLADTVLAAVDRLIGVWVGAMESAVGTLCGSEELPRQLSLWGGGSGMPCVVEAVLSFPWAERLGCSGNPEVRLMRPELIPGVLDGTGQVRDQEYACPMAVAGHSAWRASAATDWDPFLWAVKRPAAFVDRGAGN
ncbi:MAG TPA: cell division FtsA domain-containing protein [Anaerolineae bacterium]|nr:cell division FtsA domain-containing protein [Anaerolineae bacterium]